MAKKYPHIPEQLDFTNDLIKDDNIYSILYDLGFITYRQRDEIEREYRTKTKTFHVHPRNYFDLSQEYVTPDDLKRVHYSTQDGIRLALDIRIGKYHGERNEVVFRMSGEDRKKAVTKPIISAARRLRRLATIANKHLEASDIDFRRSLYGAHDGLNELLIRNYKKLGEVAYRQNYSRVLIERYAVDNFKMIYEEKDTGEVLIVSIRVPYISSTNVNTEPAKLNISGSKSAVKAMETSAIVLEIQKSVENYNQALQEFKEDQLVRRIANSA